MKINYQRKRECLSCGHEWRAPVELSAYTQNLSGERRLWCPECSSGTIMSYPATPTPPEADDQHIVS